MSVTRGALYLLACLCWMTPIFAQEPGFVGVHLRYFEEVDEGRIEITEVVIPSPAQRAGLRKGDVISKINGVGFRFRDWEQVMRGGGPMSWLAPDQRVRLTISRAGKPQDIEVIAASLPPALLEVRRQQQGSLKMSQADAALTRLAQTRGRIRVERPPGAADLRVQAPELGEEDREALAFYFNNTRLRLLFDRIPPGSTAAVAFRQRSDGQTEIEILDP